MTDPVGPRVTLKQRAAAARAQALATKAWAAQIAAACEGTVWRVASAWIEQSDGSLCADLTHVCSGKVRTVRVAAGSSMEACRAQVAD